MTRKLIASLPATVQGGMSAKVYRDPDTYGFVVLFFRDGKHLTKADHETDDKADALQTAELEVKRGNVPAFTATPNTLPRVSHTQRKRAARRAHSPRIDGPIPQIIDVAKRSIPTGAPLARVYGNGAGAYRRLMTWTASYPAHLQPNGRIPTLAEVRADCRWH